MRVALYTRISVDVDGSQTATHRQERSSRLFAQLRGWDVVEVYEDVDVSAFKATVVRPSFERLLRDVGTDRFDLVLVWRLDRLVRRPADFERFWEACEKTSTAIASASEPIDTTSEIGLAMVRILVTFAGLESATKSARLKAKFAESARSGEPAYRRRVYGLNQRWTRIVPREAAVIRAAAAQVLADIPLKVIVEDLNNRGVPSPAGRQWTRRGLRTLLVATRHSGERWHGGVMVAKGNWPAILDPATAAQVRVALADAGRRPDGHRTRTSLLRGLLRCGRCGNILGPSGPSRGQYVCRGKPRGCGGITVKASAVEDWVLQLLTWKSARIPSADPSDAAAAVSSELDALAGALHELSVDYYARRAITRGEFLATRRQLTRGAPLSDRRLAADLAAWHQLDTWQRRKVIESELESVTVGSNPAGATFDPDRLRAVWRREPSEATFVWKPRFSGVTAEDLVTGDRWLNLAEAAARLGGLSTSTVKRWCAQGRIPVARNGRQLRLKLSDVDTFLETCRVPIGGVRSLR